MIVSILRPNCYNIRSLSVLLLIIKHKITANRKLWVAWIVLLAFGSMDAAPDFIAAFQGLAKHLFPDGCPDPDLEPVWPQYDRTPAAFSEALNSYEQIVHLSLRKGLSSLQTHALIVTALPMLPHSKYKGPFATTSYFEKTLQAIIPCEQIPTCALERLLSGVTASETGRCSVLQFLYLGVSYGCVELNHLETRYYSFFIHWSVQAVTCNDSVRLLLFMVPQQRYYRRLLREKQETPGLTSLSLLLQHFTGDAIEQRIAFSNRAWEQSFQRFHKRVPLVALAWSDLDHSWNAYQLSRVAGVKPSITHSRSVLMDRWLQGDELVQRELLEQLAFLSPRLDDFFLHRVLPLWDGRDAELLMQVLPLNVSVLPYLERHFVFGSSAVQYAIGEYWMRFFFVEDETNDAKAVFVRVHDLLLRTLMIDFSSVVVFIALDVLDRCPFPADPALLYLLGLTAVSWERFRQLMSRYKDKKLIDDKVLDEMNDSFRKLLLLGGTNGEDLCHRTSVKERLIDIRTRQNHHHGSSLDDDDSSQSGTCRTELREAIQSDWPEVSPFLNNNIFE